MTRCAPSSITELRKSLRTWFGEVCYCCCLSLLPELAWDILATTYKVVLSRFLKTENRVSRYMKGQCFITVRNDSCIDTWIVSCIMYQLFPRNLLLNYPKWIDSRFLRVRINSALVHDLCRPRQKFWQILGSKGGLQSCFLYGRYRTQTCELSVSHFLSQALINNSEAHILVR